MTSLQQVAVAVGVVAVRVVVVVRIWASRSWVVRGVFALFVGILGVTR